MTSLHIRWYTNTKENLVPTLDLKLRVWLGKSNVNLAFFTVIPLSVIGPVCQKQHKLHVHVVIRVYLHFLKLNIVGPENFFLCWMCFSWQYDSVFTTGHMCVRRHFSTYWLPILSKYLMSSTMSSCKWWLNMVGLTICKDTTIFP